MRAISAPVDAEKVDRKAGFLTNTERKYLVGTWDPNDSEEGEWSDKQEQRKRSDISTRTRHAIADVALLSQHGDDALLTSVIKQGHDPDEISTFHEETVDNAKHGLAEFMIRLALDKEEADEVMAYLKGEDFEDLFDDMSEAVEESKQTAEEHKQFLGPVTKKLEKYANANDISKAEMKDAIDILWSE